MNPNHNPYAAYNSQQYDPSMIMYGGDVVDDANIHYYDGGTGNLSELTGLTRTAGEQYYSYLDPHHHHQQQQWDVGATGDPSIGGIDYHAIPPAAAAAADSVVIEPGMYYPTANLQSPLIYGTPISAVSYDSTFDMICIATNTIPWSSPQASSMLSHASSGSSRRMMQQQQRSSQLLTHHTSDLSLYSVVAGHPEAPAKVLQTIYTTLYGSTQSSIPTRTIPNHAYIPSYGKSDPALPDSVVSTYVPGTINTGNCQLGITQLVSLPGGTVASVSPAGVRVHANGGLQMADLHIEGMMALTSHPHSPTTHLSVGGIAFSKKSVAISSSDKNRIAEIPEHTTEQQLHCLDVWQGLRIVTSHTLDRNIANPSSVSVTCLATSHSRGCLVVGCSDGYIRLIDHRNRSLAKIKSHVGGVVDVTVSDDGTLVATTGYASTIPPRNPLTSPYGFADPNILVNDIRYLGRGGFPYPFTGLRGCPRYISFIPDVNTQPTNRLLVASGQAGGGCQIISPFHDTESPSPNNFIIPQLHHGEAINCMCVSEEKLALGTNQGTVLQYEMAAYQSRTQHSISSGSVSSSGTYIPSSSSSSMLQQGNLNVIPDNMTATMHTPSGEAKIPLISPPYQPVPPPLSIEASILLKTDNNNTRLGMNDRIKSVFGSYIMTAEPIISALQHNDKSHSSFGPLSLQPMIGQCRYEVSTAVTNKASHGVDLIQTTVVSDLNIDVFEDHRTLRTKNVNSPTLPNPNKFLYNNKLYKVVYTESLNRSKRLQRQSRRRHREITSDGGSDNDDNDDDDEASIIIPRRYRLCLRPTHKSATSFNYYECNETGFIPGFDYAITSPNAFVPPILLVLYFVPELREAAFKAQSLSVTSSPKDQPLLTELGYLFHRIESIYRHAYIYPANDGISTVSPRIDAWAPLSFISFLTTMTEAERNQILDGSPAAVDPPRRPEAFYRFMLYQLDNEMIRSGRSAGLVDTLAGIDFMSINEFISGSGPPTQSTMRHLTLEFSYAHFFSPEYKSIDNCHPTFGDVLQYNLFRASRLRAWSTSSKSYETIVQHKIATTLPSVLSISASCAARKGEPGVSLWHQTTSTTDKPIPWLPEMVEVEIEENGLVAVRELLNVDVSGEEIWKECRGSGSISESITELIQESARNDVVRKRRYRLDAVLSLIRDDLDHACPEEVNALEMDGPFGHQVLHVRLTNDVKKKILEQQRNTIKAYVSSEPVENDLTVAGRDADRSLFEKRLMDAEGRVTSLQSSNDNDSSWVLVNGFVVSESNLADVRTFHYPYKEPLLVIFRATDDNMDIGKSTTTAISSKDVQKSKLSKSRTESSSSSGSAKNNSMDASSFIVPTDVIRTASITNNTKSPYYMNQRTNVLPGKNDVIAFDAEFVAVTEEESSLTVSGSKLIIRETRHAIARISIVDGRTGSPTRRSIILDDHVQPIEPVVDYLTRFSGIVEQDLSPKQSRHHLISNRTSYLKLRCLIERGCIFVGHGLQQDFWIANLYIPSHQMIDTVDIYHKPAQRYISLRFLSNFVLKHDVQQDVHDSVEDAMAAYELYIKALELKRNGTFDQVLNELYDYGQKNDWKLGVDDIIE